MPREQSRRLVRLNEQLREEIADLIRRGLKDPRLAGLVSITAVEAAADLSTAKVYVSVMGSEEDKKASLNTLRHAAGFFRHELTERLTLRRVPELAFLLDQSIERGDHLLDLLRDMRREQEPSSESDGQQMPADRQEE
jgi:ribosome-binding factor A